MKTNDGYASTLYAASNLGCLFNNVWLKLDLVFVVPVTAECLNLALMIIYFAAEAIEV